MYGINYTPHADFETDEAVYISSVLCNKRVSLSRASATRRVETKTFLPKFRAMRDKFFGTKQIHED